MAKRLKQKIAKVIPSFQSCRSKGTSVLPMNPHPSLPSISTLNSNVTNPHFSHPTNPPPPPPLPSQSASSAFGVCLPSRFTPSHDDPKLTPQFQWRKEDKWHVVAKVYDRSLCPHRKTCISSISGASGFEYDVLEPPALPCPSFSQKKKKKKKKKQKKKTVSGLRISTSSEESGLSSRESFGDMDDEETEALVSYSSSSEFNPRLGKIRGKTSTPRRKKKKKKRTTKKEVHSPGCESPARLSVFQRLIPCAVEGKVRESFAVVKKSENPYKDFKRSMMEMILEKEMFDENDLVQLLHCLLSLNDKQHHGVIIEAFSEIWEALFCRRSTHPSV